MRSNDQVGPRAWRGLGVHGDGDGMPTYRPCDWCGAIPQVVIWDDEEEDIFGGIFLCSTCRLTKQYGRDQI